MIKNVLKVQLKVDGLMYTYAKYHALSFALGIKMGSLLKYQIEIIPKVIFVSLGFASGTNTPRV